MKRSWLAALVLVFTASTPAGTGEIDAFRYFKEVQREKAQAEEILSITLDSDVYAATQVGLADLRVVDATGAVVPYRIDRATETRTQIRRATSASAVVSLVENDDNSIEIVVRLGEKAKPADAMVFHTRLKDFERRVGVFGSNDGKSWELLVSDKVIYDYSRYMDVSKREVKLPKNVFRQFKIVIEAVTDRQQSAFTEFVRQFRDGAEQQRTERTTVRRRPFRIDRIELSNNVTRQRVTKQMQADHPIVAFRVEEDPDAKQTIVHVQTRREPLTSFALETASANFSRAVAVEVQAARGMATDWKQVAEGTVWAVRFRGSQREHLAIGFPEQRQEVYRIVIQNEDNPAIDITGVIAKGNVYRALFFAAADAAYRVYYDSERAEAQSYDTAALGVALGEGYEPLAGPLGPQIENPVFGEGSPLGIAELLNKPLFLGVVICLMVIVLALLLYRAGRKIDELPGE